MMKRKRKYIIISSILLCAALAGCGSGNDSMQDEIPETVIMQQEEEIKQTAAESETESENVVRGNRIESQTSDEEPGGEQETFQNDKETDGRNLEAWQQAYADYLLNDSDAAAQEGYTLITMSGDEIPQLVEVGIDEATGCRIIYYAKGEVHSAQLNRLYFSYIPGENLLCNSEGLMDTYYDLVYSIVDGEMTLIAAGYYGAEDNSNVQFDAEGNPVYQYEWNGMEMSKEEYEDELLSVYDTSRAVSYDYSSLYSADEMIEVIEKYLEG